MAFFLLILSQGALLSAEPLPDPMAGVTQDWQLCTHPDDAAKSCRVMASFKKVGADRYTEIDQMIVMGLPGLVIEVPSEAYVKEGKLCSVPRRRDFERLRVIQHVEGATPQQESAALKRIEFAYPIEGKEVCGQFYPDGDRFRIDLWVNGQQRANLETPARWVHKDDGYSVSGWRGAITTPQAASH
ncbi:MAG: hypothetical protein ACKOPG_01820 [Novosphingobium sp.]